MRGLLGRSELASGSAVWLARCNSIHTFGMRFALDLIFLGRDWRVCRIVRGVPSGRMVLGGRSAASAIEMQAGWFPEAALRVGDRVTLEEP